LADEFITPTEAARLLRTTRNTVYRWVRAGKLPARKVGGVWRIPRSALRLDARPTASRTAAQGPFRALASWPDVLDRMVDQETSHWLVVVSTPDEIYDVDASVISRALATGGRAVKGSWWQGDDDVRRQLRSRGIDVEAAERSGALVILDMVACYRRGGVAAVLARWEELLEGTRRLGFRGMWKSGSPVLDGRVPFEHVAEVEAAAATFFDRPGVRAICPVLMADDPQGHARLTRLLACHEVVVYRSPEESVLLTLAA